MRHFIFILLSVFSTVQYGQNNLRFFCAEQLFKVRLGGQLLNTNAQTEVLSENIKNDTLTVTLEFDDKNQHPFTIYLLEKGQKTKDREFAYRVDAQHQPVRLIFTGIYDRVRLPEPLVPQKPVIDTSYKINNSLLDHFCELSNGSPVYFNNLPLTGTCSISMPAGYMAHVRRLMGMAQSDDARYDVVENTCRNNCLSVEQLGGLLVYIDYEIEKLKLVKLAYFNLTNPAARKALEKSFRFASSVKELNDFFDTSHEYRLKHGNCTSASDSAAVNGLSTLLINAGNDSRRYETLKKLYDQHCYSTQQVKQLLGLFIHDREKLDAARLMYFYCVDKQNYTLLSDIFSYKETQSELSDFIGKQGRK